MKLKRLISFVLAAALCGSLWALPAAAAETTKPFPDIADTQVAEAAELLRLLGVLSGDENGRFNPGDNLTRAQFCKMAIEIRGEGDKATAMKSYTFFNDVKGDHWARGYINYASRVTVGENERLVMGVGDGNFLPDNPIKFAEAVTMTLRLLGYSRDAVASGSLWYEGYLTTAAAIGLTKGVNCAWDAPVTRAQAALLFHNLLSIAPLGGGKTYFETLGGSVTGEVILLSVNATAADGTRGSVETTDGETVTVRKTNHAPFDSSLEGRKVTLMLDGEGKVMAVTPVTGGTSRTVTLAAHEINYITTAEGEKISLPTDATLYQGGDKTTYSAVYMDLKAGAALTLNYAADGKLEYIYMSKTASTANEVVTRLTAIYEDASPSPKTPLEVQVLNQRLTVLDDAVEELAAFKPGDRVTFLLTQDGKVAGAVKPDKGSSTLVGVVTAGDKETATVSPVMGLKNAAGAEVTFSCPVSSDAERLVGELVIISSSKSGVLSLSKVSDSGAKGALDVEKRTLNGQALSPRVFLYERTAGGKPVAIGWDQITVSAVPASKITYAGTDDRGLVNVIVLEDVTGDGYTYGYLKSRIEVKDVDGVGYDSTTDSWQIPPSTYNEYYIDATTASGTEAFRIRFQSQDFNRKALPGGIVRNVSGWGEYVTLSELSNVPRSAFNMDEMTVQVGGVTYPIAGSVQCRNGATGVWFASGKDGVNAARAYSESLTLYYDKSPSQGGKIRLIEVK